MRQEMISNEINILRDTFRRLLRRKANTNLGKLIDKTHPADLALLFRFFNELGLAYQSPPPLYFRTAKSVKS